MISCWHLAVAHAVTVHDALGRLHRDFEADVRAFQSGASWASDGSKYANVEDGRMGLAFVESAVASSAEDGAWHPIQIDSPS